MLWPPNGRGHGDQFRILLTVREVAKFSTCVVDIKSVAYFGFQPESAESDSVSPSVGGGGNLSE